MCGIAGIVSFSDRYTPDEATLARMSACIAHRGPDGEGVLIARAGGAVAGFVHRRLAILDPDPRSNQPFTAEYQGRKVHLVYNGEIYNYRELRARLEKELPDYPWRTTGDTEVLLAAYFAWGPRCVEELLGMYAFALFDERDGSLVLSRDRMGQKPLYCATGKGFVAFASELSAVAAVPGVDTSLSEDSLQQYLRFGYVPRPDTIYKGVHAIQPASALRYRADKVSECHIGYFGVARTRSPVPDAPGTARRLLGEAVRSQLVSDVPLGCFLSGGIDSSVIALCAQQELARHGQTLRTFTARFDDPRYDESPYAAEVAKHLGTEHHEFLVTPDVAADLPKLAASYGQPFGDSSCLPTYYLSRETRKHVKVALAGDGGDELFGGYDRYRAMLLAERLPLAALANAVLGGERMARGHPKSTRARLGRFLSAARLPAGKRYESFVRLFPPGMLGAPPLSGNFFGDETLPDGDAAEAAMLIDLTLYLEGDLHRKVDRASMLVNLEVRAPFMDHRLVQFATGLTSKELFTGGKKGVLKRAFGHQLPRSVFARKKMGFAVPIGDWFRSTLRPMVHDLVLSPSGFAVGRWGRPAVEQIVLQHETGEVDHTQRIFALVMLELWHRGRP